ncbi:disease resistance protein (TIR-NBS-LRR class) [Artemisia annua]|uniref:Disease resistance protein (TIR-NBS-LRR class) n=1 Tax=Artemisia annua TaxID=35608 RepID=A0A2U1QLR3_ARTAN|nr:disease resistance protein (TIR-NBS-LRR class) [Artemisia annua]
MASSSTSFSQKSFKYDVFLSFRGEDTRKNFVDHLYYALQQKGVETYKDDERIMKGKRITDELINAIQDSKLYIIVFSKKYASSSWCLDELAKIMECQKMTEHTAYPVFYDVEPTQVRKQSGPVKKAFAKIRKKEAAEKWTEAMKEASDLVGWELKNTLDGHEAKVIQKIVKEILLELRFVNFSVDKKLIGMETRVDGVVSSLESSVVDVSIIGIKGMGGAGKTTLARAVYDQISFQFEGQSFVENVREVSKASLSGLKDLQKEILSDVLNDQSITVSSVHDGKKMMRKMMHGRKVLIVLDDVDKIEQLEALVGERDWFKPGSKIIVTTRDMQVLVAHGVKTIYDVNLLSDEEAICLFSRYAFGREIPIQGYEELSEQVVRYAAGLPLTIRVLGSFLCGKDDLEWEDAIDRLKTIPLKETIEKLELSYYDLEEDYKEIFLDVACLLKGWGKNNAIRALQSCGFHGRNGLRVLEQKSLITISIYGRLEMHDHIEEMGRNIVRRLHPDKPYRHSRLWIDKEIGYILANDLGTQETKCIKLDAGGFNTQVLMKGLANMEELRFLDMNTTTPVSEDASNGTIWNFDEVSLYLPNALRFLRWNCYPFSSLPKTFQANNLVEVDMYCSNMVQLWEDGVEKACLKLRFLKFTYSKLRTLDLSVAPNLETVTLENCYNLVEVHFQVTPNLKELRIYDCNRLEKLHLPAESPKLRSLYLNDSKLRKLHLGITPNLEELFIECCYDLVELHMPSESPKLRHLDLGCSKLMTLHLGITPNLETLRLNMCTDMVELQIHAECPKLVNLDLSNLKLITLHLGITPNLETLRLYSCIDMVELHMPAECPKLVNLDLDNLKLMNLHLGITPNLETFSLYNCIDMVELHMPAECPKLVNFDLGYLKLKTLHFAITPNLETLRLNNCTDMVELQIPAECPNLVTLDLNNVMLRNLDLGLTPSLERLNLKNCYELGDINAPVGCMKKLVCLNISGCGRLKSFWFDKEIHSPKVGSLCELHLIAFLKDVASDNSWPEFEFSCYYKEDPASYFGNLETLISLGSDACITLDWFSDIICGLKCLRKLTLEGSFPDAPKDLDQLECLEVLILSSTEIKNLPDSICMLKYLKSLEIKFDWYLEKLPEDIGRLECLENLNLSECLNLRDVPNNICELKRLEYINLSDCYQVKKLPEEIGRPALEPFLRLKRSKSGVNRLITDQSTHKVCK